MRRSPTAGSPALPAPGSSVSRAAVPVENATAASGGVSLSCHSRFKTKDRSARRIRICTVFLSLPSVTSCVPPAKAGKVLDFRLPHRASSLPKMLIAPRSTSFSTLLYCGPHLAHLPTDQEQMVPWQPVQSTRPIARLCGDWQPDEGGAPGGRGNDRDSF